MSSPSDNISSGRSSPDDGVGGMSNGIPRRSSTPAQSFLPPRFWATQPSYQQSNYSDAAGGSVPRRTSFGTTFSNGGRLSALSALGMSPHNNPALYGYPNTKQQQQPQSQQSFFGGGSDVQRKRTLSPAAIPQLERIQQGSLNRNNSSNDHAVITSAESTPTPSMPSSPVQKPQKRSVCLLPGPDGLCVESRGRRRSEA
jgi:hypothetical protein